MRPRTISRRQVVLAAAASVPAIALGACADTKRPPSAQGPARDVRLVVDAARGDVLAPSREGARFLLFAGRPVGEPVARSGPFVMNTDDELQRAWDDYRSGRLVDGA